MRYGKCMVVAMAAFFSVGAMPSYAQSTPKTFAPGTTMERIVNAGKVRIGVKFDQPLMGEKNLRGELEGIDIEIAKLITSGLGLSLDNIEWVETTSINREPFIEQNKVDLIVASYVVTDKRKQVVTFAGPYLVARDAILVAYGNPNNFKAPPDLAGRKVCAPVGAEGMLRIKESSPEAIPVGFDTVSKCAEALKNGSVDAVSAADTVLAGYAKKEPGTFEVVTFETGSQPNSVGVKKGDIEFCKFITGVLQEAAADGRFQQAYSSTLGTVLKSASDLPPSESCE